MANKAFNATETFRERDELERLEKFLDIVVFVTSFAAFILTLIGVSLSARKVKGGMGLNLGIGIGLSFGYIVFQTISSTFAVNGNMPPIVAVWIPNIVFLIIGVFLYWKAPK